MEHVRRVNPFATRETHNKGSLWAYRIFTIVTWLVNVIATINYLFNKPHEGKYARHSIWKQNKLHPTPFALNEVITTIYWIVLWIFQVGYLWHLFASNAAYVSAAANVGSHFIFNNLLSFGFIMLWVRSHFWLAELLLVINFFNLLALYLRHSAHPRLIHIPVVSGPLSWTLIAILWDGAVMVHAHNLPARILANIFIWTILLFGSFFLAVFRDYTVGFELSILTASLGVSQFLTKVIALQWIFAFVIMGTLFVLTLIVSVPGIFGTNAKFGAADNVVSDDRERAPLLEDH
ncbi:MAG: hypothetical protein M4579_005005 [Chaenotheca gracillima]|nr:MAG: hypothetical protein M4579_005005 [Chaenotheca gracillima]